MGLVMDGKDILPQLTGDAFNDMACAERKSAIDQQ
jgi:hypothetical protein